MITSKDLMIGDWVKLSRGNWSENRQVGFVDIEMIAESVYLAEPIHLTPEILEKNFQEFLPGINLMYQLKGPYCAMNEDGQWVFGLVKVDGENSARYPLVKISFVHELQHALRLCGITLNIKI